MGWDESTNEASDVTRFEVRRIGCEMRQCYGLQNEWLWVCTCIWCNFLSIEAVGRNNGGCTLHWLIERDVRI